MTDTGHVQDGQNGLGSHHSLGGKDERTRSWLRDIKDNDVVTITVWIVLIWPAWLTRAQMEPALVRHQQPIKV